MILKAIIYGIFLTGIIAIEVTNSEAYTSKSISDDSIVVESNGSLALSNTIRLSVGSLTVKSSAQFLTNNAPESVISIGPFNNVGYTLFDVSQVEEPFVWFKSSNYNSGDLVIHGHVKLSVRMDMLVNWGSMTIWGGDGVKYTSGVANYRDMCFHGSFVEKPLPETTSSLEEAPTAEAAGVEEASVVGKDPVVEQSSSMEAVPAVEEPVLVE